MRVYVTIIHFISYSQYIYTLLRNFAMHLFMRTSLSFP